MMTLDGVYNLSKRLVGWLVWSQQIAYELVGSSSNATEQHRALLVGAFDVIHDQVLLKALHLGVPVLLSVLELTDRAVSGHVDLVLILVANVVTSTVL